ncbi:MAG: thioredoxin family protein [Bacteroidia bacterium]
MNKLILGSIMSFLAGFLLVSRPVAAQETGFVSNFSLQDPDGRAVSLDQYKNDKVVVVVFTSSNCVWATKYQDRLTALHTQYHSKGVRFLAINSNDAAMSQRDAVSRMAVVSPYPFPYLKDDSQQVARLFGAEKTPETFVLVPREGRFSIAYRGKIDDNPIDPKLVRSNYLVDALDSVLVGKPPRIAHEPANGCFIKWKETVVDNN